MSDVQNLKSQDLSPILIIGDDKLACSLAICLALSGTPVSLYTNQLEKSTIRIARHKSALKKQDGWKLKETINVINQWPIRNNYQIAFILNHHELSTKKDLIKRLEHEQDDDLLIAVGTEYTPVSQIQEGSARPENIIGANWTEPAHTTFFLELIKNTSTKDDVANRLMYLSKTHWKKDPYLIKGELGIRSKMVCALIREAFYLVKNGYATPEDIDRSCRNDGGTYLPFAGNFRYMDLMGTYAYGVVMQELNKELANDKTTPAFFDELLEGHNLGIKSGAGFYDYPGEKVTEMENKISAFSYQIRRVMEKYNGQDLSV